MNVFVKCGKCLPTFPTYASPNLLLTPLCITANGNILLAEIFVSECFTFN